MTTLPALADSKDFHFLGKKRHTNESISHLSKWKQNKLLV